MMGRDEVSAPEFRVYWPTDGYVRCDFLDGAVVTPDLAPVILAAVDSVSEGVPRPLLVDLREARAVSREARTAFAGSDGATRLVLFVESSLSRIIGNFFVGVSGPSIPTKVFDDIDAAQRWLLNDE